MSGAAKLRVGARREPSRRARRQRDDTRAMNGAQPLRPVSVFERDDTEADLDTRLDQVVETAREPLPNRAALERASGATFADVRVAAGPEATEVLDEIGAEAATVDNVILLRGLDASDEVVAHELVHVLQARAANDSADADAAEQEADELASGLALRAELGEAGEVEPVATLPPATIAKRGLNDTAMPEDDAAQDRYADALAEPIPARPEPQTDEPAATPAPPATGSVFDEPPAADLETLEGAAFEPAEAPDLSLSADAKAARDAEIAATEQAIANADDVDALMTGFADAPPSAKARLQGTLANKAGSVAEQENAAFDNEVPEFHAEMSGDVEVPEAPPLDTGAETPQGDVEGSVAPAPDPEIAPTKPFAAYRENDGVLGWLARFFDADPAKAVGQSIRDVKTGDDVETSPGAPPEVPKEGETDPERIEQQRGARRDEARGKRDGEVKKVVEGRGPEASQPKPLDEAYAVKRELAPDVAEAQSVPGADAFVGFGLPEEVEAAVDAKNRDAMTASLSGARAEVDAGTKARDADRASAVEEAEKKRRDMSETADAEQAKAVGDARAEIQTSRKDTVAAQRKAVQGFETDAETERKLSADKVDGEITSTETKVKTDYENAEKKADKEVEKGETEAEDKKREAERESENQSWWDRAKNFVKKALKALTDAIGKIFDAVRKLVKDILDKVKEAVKKLIDLAAAAIKKAIRAFGEALKGLVNTLLADTFPGLAKALNDKIDGAVEVAEKAVDKAADTLKKGVDALVDALAKALDKIILAYQTAVSAGLALAYGAMTGDWAEAARIVLEPLLELLGIDKEEFYGYVGRAADTLTFIVDNAGTFVSNLWTAFKNGVGLFRDNFFTHLKNGVIAWLTGSLGGGFTIPKSFDVLGVLDLARQVLGLTMETLRRIAVRVFGEKAVEVVEFVVTEVAAIIKGGWAALWSRIQEAFDGLVDMVLGKLKEFVVTRLIIAAIEKVASLFTPVGALVQLVMTIWNMIMFLKDQFDRIAGVLRAVVQAITNIINGVLEPAAKGIETALANALPAAIDLVAKLARLGGIPAKVREVIGSIRKRIEDAAVKLLRKIGKSFKSFFKRKGGANPKAGNQPAAAKQKSATVEVGEKLTVEAPGGSHTLWFRVQGRDATLILSSDPTPLRKVLIALGNSAEALPKDKPEDKTKRDKVIADVRKAKQMREALDKSADAHVGASVAAQQGKGAGKKPGQAPAGVPDDSAIDAKEEQLRDVLVRIYKGLGRQNAPKVLEKFKTQIEALHPGARTAVIELLHSDDAKYAKAEWADVVKDLKLRSPLFLKPLLKENRGPYGGGLRGAIATRIQTQEKDEKAFDPVRAKIETFLSSNYLPKLHGKSGAAFAEALDAIQKALLSNEAYAKTAARLNASLIEAAKAAGSEDADPDLKAIGGPAVPEFLENMAQNKNYGKLAAKDWVGKWWGVPANQSWIRDKFRLGGGEHEWVPTSYIGDVIARARQEMAPGQDAKGAANAAGAAVRWARFHNRFRSPTKLLVYKPDGAAKREIDYVTAANKTVKAQVLQGHVGAVYAPVKESGFLSTNPPGKADPSTIKPQTQNQGPWHDGLRDIFNANKGKAGDTAAVPTILKKVLKYHGDTVWTGDPAPANNGPNGFNEYYGSTGSFIGYAKLAADRTKKVGDDRKRLAKVVDNLDKPNP